MVIEGEINLFPSKFFPPPPISPKGGCISSLSLILAAGWKERLWKEITSAIKGTHGENHLGKSHWRPHIRSMIPVAVKLETRFILRNNPLSKQFSNFGLFRAFIRYPLIHHNPWQFCVFSPALALLLREVANCKFFQSALVDVVLSVKNNLKKKRKVSLCLFLSLSLSFLKVIFNFLKKLVQKGCI